MPEKSRARSGIPRSKRWTAIIRLLRGVPLRARLSWSPQKVSRTPGARFRLTRLAATRILSRFATRFWVFVGDALAKRTVAIILGVALGAGCAGSNPPASKADPGGPIRAVAVAPADDAVA